MKESDYTIYINKKVCIKTDGIDRPFIYNGQIISIGKELIKFKDDRIGIILIPLKQVIILIPEGGI